MRTIDLFLWANKTDGQKNDLDVELFLVNKNMTPYSVRVASNLYTSIRPLFLYDLISHINMGAATGMVIRDIEKADNDGRTVAYAPLGKVGRAETLIHLIENERGDIVEFDHDEHEFKRLKAIVARYTHPADKDVLFYVIKQLPSEKAVYGQEAWQFHAGEFAQLSLQATLKMPSDNQMLVVGPDMFVFNQAKFKAVFDYDARQIELLNEKGAILDKHYRLSFPDLIHELSFACVKKATQNKLLAVNTDDLMSQEKVLEIADEMQLQLMCDDDGAIIIMDDGDASTLLDIINDNYVTGSTGHAYLAKKKQELEIAVESQKEKTQ